MALRNWPKATWRGAPALVAHAPEEHVSKCPMGCAQDHDSCHFQAGSLYCITHDCANPHHRSRV